MVNDSGQTSRLIFYEYLILNQLRLQG